MLFLFTEEKGGGSISYALILALGTLIAFEILMMSNLTIALACIVGFALLSLGSSALILACLFVNRT